MGTMTQAAAVVHQGRCDLADPDQVQKGVAFSKRCSQHFYSWIMYMDNSCFLGCGHSFSCIRTVQTEVRADVECEFSREYFICQVRASMFICPRPEQCQMVLQYPSEPWHNLKHCVTESTKTTVSKRNQELCHEMSTLWSGNFMSAFMGLQKGTKGSSSLPEAAGVTARPASAHMHYWASEK